MRGLEETNLSNNSKHSIHREEDKIMGSESSSDKIPVINFSLPNLNAGTPSWDLVKSNVRNALEEYGCFEALFDKIALQLRNDIMSALEELFDLPLQTKRLEISKKPYNGYTGQYPILPLFESIGIDSANIIQKVEEVTNTFWPQGNPSFSKTAHSFSEKAAELDKMVRRMIVESLGLEKYLEEHLSCTDYTLKVMKYKAPNTAEPKLGLLPHSDKNMVSILCPNEVVGLEVQTKHGEWITVKPTSPHSFIVFIGDSFHAWTNGRLCSPIHRVMISGNETRYTAGLLSVPKVGYLIKAPEEMIDEEHPLLFKPFEHDQYLEFLATFRSQAGHDKAVNESALKVYVGV